MVHLSFADKLWCRRKRVGVDNLNIQITPGMTHGGSQFTPQQWGEGLKTLAFSNEPEHVAVRTYIGLLYGGVALKAIPSGVKLGLAYRRNPVLMILANHAKHAGVRFGATAMLQGSKAIRYAGYVQMSISPLMTYKYVKRGDYTRAALAYYGPPGTVWAYNKMTQQYEKTGETSQKPVRSTTSRVRPGKKPSQISSAQKKRMWRMGLRWCKKHNRYDRCSLRARR